MHGSQRVTGHLPSRLLNLCFVASVSVALANATVIPHLDVPNLCDKADLVVIGRVVGHQRLGTTSLGPGEGNMLASLMLARVDVEKVLKGHLDTPSVTFRFVLPYEGIGYRGVSDGRFGIFFLRWVEEGYHVLDPYYPYVPAAPGAPPVAGNCVDKTTGELAHVFVSRDPSAQSRWTRWEAVRALETVPTPLASTALRAATEDKDPLVRVWAISALVSRGDISMLEQVEKLGTIPPDPRVENLTARLGSAIERVRDKRAIPQLARLLHSEDVNIRRGAAAALRNIHDGAVIMPLTQALYDSDRDVQYQAVIGLAEIMGAGSEWAPAYDTFLNDQGHYLTHWRDWAKSTK
jgi:hypothetical protein